MKPVRAYILLISLLPKKLKNRKNAVKRPVLYAIAAGFLFSLTIETLQLMLRLGTFQLSDICYNTLGGMIGGVMFWIIRLIRKQ